MSHIAPSGAKEIFDCEGYKHFAPTEQRLSKYYGPDHQGYSIRISESGEEAGFRCDGRAYARARYWR